MGMSMSMSQVVIAFDFSDEARIALDQGIAIARQHGAEVTLVYVGVATEYPQAALLDLPDAVVSYSRIVDDYVATEKARLDELVAQISGQGITATGVLSEGSPARQILQLVSERSADLVITGTHGRTGLKRFFLGSVAEKVVRLSKTPVLVARPRADESQGLRRILVATDFSESAERALTTAIALGGPEATIDILHCWFLEPLSYPSYVPTQSGADLSMSLRKSIEGGAARQGAELLIRHQKAECTMEFHTKEAPPVHGIQDWLERRSYDLVVTGSHGRRGAARLLMGSVAEMTVRHSPCSVLVVHAGEG